MTYIVTVVVRGSSEGRAFDTLDEAVAYTTEQAREALSGRYPEDVQIEFYTGLDDDDPRDT